MRKIHIVITIALALVCGLGLLTGCKSEAQVKAEQNIRTYVDNEGRGMLKVTKIEYLGDEQNYDGIVWSNYRTTLMPTDGRKMYTTMRFMTNPETGEILDVQD